MEPEDAAESGNLRAHEPPVGIDTASGEAPARRAVIFHGIGRDAIVRADQATTTGLPSPHRRPNRPNHLLSDSD
jgi:hypothetical protein